MDNSLSTLYPWQQPQWTMIQSMISNDRLPHALMITGAKGMGLLNFADNLAASILCEQPDESGYGCQKCSACLLLKADTHPDLLPVFPEEEGKEIKVDQIRKLVSFSQLQSHYSQRKVIIVNPAESMNNNAANSLLKTLEEPPGSTLIILVSHQPSFLPITIRSRCQKIKISASPRHVTEWLRGKIEPDQIQTVLAAGCGPLFLESNEAQIDEKTEQSPDRLALLKDLENMAFAYQDPVDTAERWSQNEINDTVFWLIKICQDMVRIKSAANSEIKLMNPDMSQRLSKLVEKYNLKEIFRIYDKLFEYHQLISRNSNLKAATMLEDFTIEWVTLSKK